MSSAQGSVTALLVAIALFGSGGCVKSPDTRFYILTPMAASERPLDATAGKGPIVGLRPVGLPEQLDRPQIVTRSGGNTLQLAPFDYWAAPLRDNFSRVLAEDLAILVPADRVAIFPWSREAGVDYEVTVDVVRFEGALGGDSALVADWIIVKRVKGAKDLATTGRSNHTESTGGSYADVAAASSHLIAALSRDIATALTAMPR